MCGIFGVVTTESFAIGKLLVEAGIRLSYRGYDTVGIASEHLGEITLRKDAGKIVDVDSRLDLSSMVGNKGILQLRWATFGVPNQRNSQPHFSCDCTIAGAHNGNILNTHDLNKTFLAEGHVIRSDNDGEVCVHAVERYLMQGEDPITALRHAADDLEGHYAFAFYRQGENKIYAIKQGISLSLAIGDGITYVSSDLPCLLPFSQTILRIEDNEIAELSPEGIRLFSVVTGEELFRDVEICDEEIRSNDKEGFPHYMLKEIYEQPERIRNMLQHNLNTGSYETFVRTLSQCHRAFFIGAGTSYHACLGASYAFNQLAGVPVHATIASSFIEQYGNCLDENTAIVLVSQSGETKDVVNVIHHARRRNLSSSTSSSTSTNPSLSLPILSVVNVAKSTIMNLSDTTLLLRTGFEVSVPATKTYTNQLSLFYSLAIAVAEARGQLTSSEALRKQEFLVEEIPRLIEEQIEEIREEEEEEEVRGIHSVASRLSNVEDLYILGFGLTQATALEAALKFKEITYSHAEGTLAPEFKHGPLSIIDEGYPVLFFIAPKDHMFLANHISEVKCRRGTTIVIANQDENLREQVDYFIEVPKIPEEMSVMAPLVHVVPLQMLAYYSALMREYDPDTPRNLSKTLTVD